VVTAPPPPKVIAKGLIGVSLWVFILEHKFAFFQPLYRVLAALRSLRLGLSAGTVTGGLQKLLPLFQPVYQALVEHNRQAGHWHADETRWLVFQRRPDKPGFAWTLWVFAAKESIVFVLDPTRAHNAPEDHFGDHDGIVSVDRYSAYKAMRQVKSGHIILAFCWAHVRRDFLEVLTAWPELTDWAWSWVEAIAILYALNDARLAARAALTPPAAATPDSAHVSPAATADSVSTPPLAEPSPLAPPAAGPSPRTSPAAADTPPAADPANLSPTAAALVPLAPLADAERQLRQHVQHLAQRRDRELAQPDLRAPQRKVLTSLQNHWSGLTVFLDHPEVPLDNNEAERRQRGPVVARKNYYGSGALWSGRLAAMLFSLLQTLSAWKLDVRGWLTWYLGACAAAGSQPPANVASYLPWNLSPQAHRRLSHQPGSAGPATDTS
jgi:hypothetical protein